MQRWPGFLTFACRGFAMALPMAVLFGYYAWLVSAGPDAPRADAAPRTDAAKADRSNAVIATCVDAERAAGRSGAACIGRFYGPCQARPDMQAPAEQSECLEREFVLWRRVMGEAKAAVLERLASPAKAAKLQEAQTLWAAFHAKDCRLPYHLLDREAGAEALGLKCSIDRTARRALQLRDWLDRLSDTR